MHLCRKNCTHANDTYFSKVEKDPGIDEFKTLKAVVTLSHLLASYSVCETALASHNIAEVDGQHAFISRRPLSLKAI